MGAALALEKFRMPHYVDQTGCFRPAALMLLGVLLEEFARALSRRTQLELLF